MARQTLVLDASVGVKWFSAIGEANVSEARSILKAQSNGELYLIVPDLFFHEISNALTYKKTVSLAQIDESLSMLFALELSIFPVNDERLRAAVRLARKTGISEYDTYYAIAAIESNCPLVTANPRYQKPELGCRVIPLDKWVE